MVSEVAFGIFLSMAIALVAYMTHITAYTFGKQATIKEVAECVDLNNVNLDNDLFVARCYRYARKKQGVIN